VKAWLPSTEGYGGGAVMSELVAIPWEAEEDGDDANEEDDVSGRACHSVLSGEGDGVSWATKVTSLAPGGGACLRSLPRGRRTRCRSLWCGCSVIVRAIDGPVLRSNRGEARGRVAQRGAAQRGTRKPRREQGEVRVLAVAKLRV